MKKKKSITRKVIKLIVLCIAAVMVLYGATAVNWQTVGAGLRGEPTSIHQSADNTEEFVAMVHEKLAIIAERDEQIAVLKEQNKQANNQLTALKNERNEISSDVIRLLAQIGALTDELSTKNNELDSKDVDIADFIAQLAALTEELTIKNAALAESDVQILELEGVINSKDAVIADLIAQLEEGKSVISISFAEDSWEVIGIIAESGMAEHFYSVGDEKEIALKRVWAVDEVITVQILDFYRDVLADGKGKAKMTLGSKYVFSGSDIYQFSTVHDDRLPETLSRFPDELQSIIKTATKKLNPDYSFDTKLFLFSPEEIKGGVGVQYEYWRVVKDGRLAEDRIKYSEYIHEMIDTWILRDGHIVGQDGVIEFVEGDVVSSGLVFGFCI